MEIFVISLIGAKDRRNHIQKEFTDHAILFEFFDAITPDVATMLANQYQLKVNEKYLTQGELACLMSHISLWKKMVDENVPYMAIFEDDIFLGEDSKHFLNQTNWVEPDWHIIKLEAFTPKVFLSDWYKNLSLSDRKIYQLKGENLGTAGYILSLDGARSLLDFVTKTEKLIALDHLMFGAYIKEGDLPVFQMNPALCIQELELNRQLQPLLESSLINERHQRMRKYKKRGWGKFIQEIYRILRQIKALFFAKTVSFK